MFIIKLSKTGLMWWEHTAGHHLLEAQHSGVMICSGLESALLQLSAVCRYDLRHFSSGLCAISPTKWLLFINQDLVEPEDFKESGDRHVTGSWWYHTEPLHCTTTLSSLLWFTALSHPFSFPPAPVKKRQTKNRPNKQTWGLFFLTDDGISAEQTL